MSAYIVVLLLTFTDGSTFQDNRTAISEANCREVIQQWVSEMHQKYEGQSDPSPSMFLTGCVKKDA